MKPAIRSLLLFVAGWGVVCVALFLWLAGFFSSWDGQAVSVRSSDPDQRVYEVLIVEDDGSRFESAWPAYAVEGLSLTIDPLALPPKPLPTGLARTTKAMWTMSFDITPEGGSPRTVATPQPQSLALAVLLFVVGIGGRNMMVAGSPFSIEPRGITLPKAQTPPGQSSSGPDDGPNRVSRGRKGPPPAKRRRGGGRRR